MSRTAMMPMTMVSMGIGRLKGFAEAGIERSEKEEPESHGDIDEVGHKCGCKKAARRLKAMKPMDTAMWMMSVMMVVVTGLKMPQPGKSHSKRPGP